MIFSQPKQACPHSLLVLHAYMLSLHIDSLHWDVRMFLDVPGMLRVKKKEPQAAVSLGGQPPDGRGNVKPNGQ